MWVNNWKKTTKRFFTRFEKWKSSLYERLTYTNVLHVPRSKPGSYIKENSRWYLAWLLLFLQSRDFFQKTELFPDFPQPSQRIHKVLLKTEFLQVKYGKIILYRPAYGVSAPISTVIVTINTKKKKGETVLSRWPQTDTLSISTNSPSSYKRNYVL